MARMAAPTWPPLRRPGPSGPERFSPSGGRSDRAWATASVIAATWRSASERATASPWHPAANVDAGIPSRTQPMCSHVCDSRGLLGRVGRRPCRWCRRFPSRGTRVTTSTPHGLRNVEVARGEGASLFDRGSHPAVVRHGILEDGQDVLSTVGRPRRNSAASIDAQGLRRLCHRENTMGGRHPLRHRPQPRLRRTRRLAYRDRRLPGAFGIARV